MTAVTVSAVRLSMVDEILGVIKILMDSVRVISIRTVFSKNEMVLSVFDVVVIYIDTKRTVRYLLVVLVTIDREIKVDSTCSGLLIVETKNH